MRTAILSILVLCGLAATAAAIPIGAVTIRDGSNRSVGSVDSDGTVRGSNNGSTGKIEKDGTIRDGSNASVGKIDDDGTVRNGSNSSIGKVESDGTIRDGSNRSIGKIDGYERGLRFEVAALLFFFGAADGIKP